MMLSERCERCGSQVFRRQDDQQQHYDVVCISGHTIRYEALDAQGAVVDTVTVANRPALLSTQEWARDSYGDDFWERVKALSEGTYGPYADP